MLNNFYINKNIYAYVKFSDIARAHKKIISYFRFHGRRCSSHINCNIQIKFEAVRCLCARATTTTHDANILISYIAKTKHAKCLVCLKKFVMFTWQMCVRCGGGVRVLAIYARAKKIPSSRIYSNLRSLFISFAHIRKNMCGAKFIKLVLARCSPIKSTCWVPRAMVFFFLRIRIHAQMRHKTINPGLVRARFFWPRRRTAVLSLPPNVNCVRARARHIFGEDCIFFCWCVASNFNPTV